MQSVSCTSKNCDADLSVPASPEPQYLELSSFKKTLRAAEQDRPEVARRRTQWRKYQGRLDPKRLVFIDETGARPT